MNVRALFSNVRNILVNAVRGQYEAGKRWSPARSYLHGWVQDPRFDATQATRLELVRKSRWFEKNDALAQGLAEVFTEFTVGANGPPITPASSDDEWNERSSDWLAEWYPLADLSSRLGYAGLITTAGWRRFFDGEFFILKTSGENKGRPRLQGISAHRVSTPGEHSDKEGKTIIDGVEIDSRGRPTAYWIQEGIDDDRFTRRTASEIIHIFEPESPGQYRGLPILTPVMNDLHDFADLFMFEMSAAKVQSKDAIFVKNAAGNLDRAKLLRERFSASANTDVNKPDEWKARLDYYQKAYPGRTLAGLAGDEIQYLKSERPSVAQQWFFDYLATRVCMGVGISKMLVLPWSIQGTIGRGEYERSRNYFLSRFAPFASAVQQIYWFAIGVARFSDPRIAAAPFDWTKVTVRPPRTVNVDVGRNSAATIADLDANLTTYEEQYAMRGLDWREQFRQRIREEKFLDKECAKEGMDPSRIRLALKDALKENIEKENERQKQEDMEAATV